MEDFHGQCERAGHADTKADLVPDWEPRSGFPQRRRRRDYVRIYDREAVRRRGKRNNGWERDVGRKQ